MGMDVYGKNPTSEHGKYFRNNAWNWRPLANYIIDIAPQIANKCLYWQSNDEDGLDAADSVALAVALQAEIDIGNTLIYEKRYRHMIETMPDIDCDICGGTGKRAPPPRVGPGDKACNGCGSTGRRRPSAASYPFSAENVQSFVAFLRDCGGFEIL